MPYQDDQNLTTLPTLKQWLAIPDAGADTILTQLIGAASEWFRMKLDREFLFLRTVIEQKSGDGFQNVLYLKQRPIVSITSITVDGTAVLPPTSLYGLGYIVKPWGLLYQGSAWSFGENNIEVVYQAGWTPQGPEGQLLETGALMLIKWWWTARAHGDQTAQSLGQQITAKFSEEPAPPAVQDIVQKLKRKTP